MHKPVTVEGEHLNLIAATNTPPSRREIQPLDEFYLRNLRPLLEFELMEGVAMPEPYRTLLVHQRDMTRTLEGFHHDSIHLRVISRRRDGENYWRESILLLDATQKAVEYGAIKIHLANVPEPGRTQILEERLPLGGILNAAGLQYISRPSAYFRCDPDSFICDAFSICKGGPLYGRQNTLRLTDGRLVAEIIEILPPA